MQHNDTARSKVLAELEAQRWQAQQAAREQAHTALVANALERAAELVLEGRYTEARRHIVLNLGWGA